MTVEALIVSALSALVGGRVYPDLAPDPVSTPYIVYQQVGGRPVNFVDSATLPSKANGRFQITVWSATRLEVAALSKAAADVLRADAGLQTTVLGQPVADYDAVTKLRGSRQDFSFWTDS